MVKDGLSRDALFWGVTPGLDVLAHFEAGDSALDAEDEIADGLSLCKAPPPGRVKRR